jgi:hypothetical protein
MRAVPAADRGLSRTCCSPTCCWPTCPALSICASCRHPLLYGDYLLKKEQQRRAPQRAGGDAGPLRRLSNRKDVMARVHGLGAQARPACCAADACEQRRRTHRLNAAWAWRGERCTGSGMLPAGVTPPKL